MKHEAGERHKMQTCQRDRQAVIVALERAHPPAPNEDARFDYAAEDAILAQWRDRQ